MNKELSARINADAEAMLSAISAILQIPSVRDEATFGPDTPFGQPIADALNHTLHLCESFGMQTQNFAGFAGHAEFGAGDEIVAMLGHLDVVPAGDDWTVNPWGGLRRDGFVYGRGASDDKGPTYAALFGAKAVLDLAKEQAIDLPRRIRLIFGCDEESDWLCMAHYFGAAGQPKPTYAFTPDSDFPLVYAEKGSFTAIAHKPLPDTSAAPLRVASFDSGLRSNMVPDRATALLTGDGETLELAAHVLNEMPGIATERTNNGLIVRATGVSAHGSLPDDGDNAAVKLMRALTSNLSAFDELAATDFAWMNDLVKRGATDGSGVGIAGTDGIGTPLTCNLGVVRTENGVVSATFNVRYPVTWDGEMTLQRFADTLAETGWATTERKHTPSLYVPQDAEPVKTLLRVYREQTGDNRAPLAMGGRTYATTVAPVGVAFGPAMPGDPEVAHRADERVSEARLIQCAKIYAHAFWELVHIGS